MKHSLRGKLIAALVDSSGYYFSGYLNDIEEAGQQSFVALKHPLKMSPVGDRQFQIDSLEVLSDLVFIPVKNILALGIANENVAEAYHQFWEKQLESAKSQGISTS